VVYNSVIKDALQAASPLAVGAHNDFFMLGDQFAGISSEHNKMYGSTINRKNNRLVFINEEVPFLLSTRLDPANPNPSSAPENNKKTFDQSTMLAFVVVLEKAAAAEQ